MPRRGSKRRRAAAAPAADEQAPSGEGPRDALGRLHGRCTDVDEEGNRFEGRFAHGERCGRGSLHFADGSVLTGLWNQGVLQGPGTYVADDGSRVEGQYVDGELTGRVRELAVDGALVYSGEYRDGVRHGHGALYMEEGSVFEGEWREGQLHGEVTFRFQRLLPFYLRGRWRHGEMAEARFAIAHEAPDGTVTWRSSPRSAGAVFRADVSTRDRISSEPLLADPFEQELVEVRPSRIAGAGEGMFARMDIPAHCVCSFYGGVRLSQIEVDARDWSLNANAITVTEESPTEGEVIDVPPPFDACAHYVASLGHKGNHSAAPNAFYILYEHPRLGLLKALRTSRAVAKDEEITVSYDYDHETVPEWYVRYQQQAKAPR